MKVFKKPEVIMKSLLSRESEAILYRKAGKEGGAWFWYKYFTGLSPEKWPSHYREIQKILDKPERSFSGEDFQKILDKANVPAEKEKRKLAEENFFEIAAIEMLISKELNEKIKKPSICLRETLETAIEKPLNELTEREIEQYSGLIKKYQGECKTLEELREKIKVEIGKEIEK